MEDDSFLYYLNLLSDEMRLESVKMFPVMLGWKFTLQVVQGKKFGAHYISSVPGTSRESTVIQITDIRCLRKVIDMPHLVRDNVYFQSAPNQQGRKWLRKKTQQPRISVIWARPNKRWWQGQRYKVGTQWTNKGFIQASQQTFGKCYLSADHMQFTLNYLSVVLVRLHC